LSGLVLDQIYLDICPITPVGMPRTVITGSGSFVPERKLSNEDFHTQKFYTEDSVIIDRSPELISRKFQEITGISHRRWADDMMNSSDLAYQAAARAIEDSGVDPETLDQIIVAHNFGDIQAGTIQSEAVPSIASRVKNKLSVKNESSRPTSCRWMCSR